MPVPAATHKRLLCTGFAMAKPSADHDARELCTFAMGPEKALESLKPVSKGEPWANAAKA